MAIETRFLVGGFGDILVIVFIFMPVVQIVQMCKKTLRPCDVSYLIFAVNGTTAMFFFCDFIRIKDIIGFIPNAISKSALTLGLPLNVVCFIIHATFHYDHPTKIYVIAGTLVYTAVVVSLSLLVLPITVVSSLAVFFNVTMGLATFQKFVCLSCECSTTCARPTTTRCFLSSSTYSPSSPVDLWLLMGLWLTCLKSQSPTWSWRCSVP